MPRKRLLQELYVFMNNKRVGTLTRQPSGILIFQYDSAWLAWENTRPISLSMPLTEARYQGEVVRHFFDNLLPDSELIRERIQARFQVQSNNCFDLLSQIGADCVGALQLLTEVSAPENQKIHAKPINDKSIAALLKHYQSAPLGMDRNSDFRISIAGAQEKTALLWYQNQWYLPEHTTPTTHIIKLPIGTIKHSGIDLSDSIENEWLCLQILSAYGLPVNSAQIVKFSGVKALVVERFDRQWVDGGKWLIRLPQEDMCQVLGKSSALKYESDSGPGIQSIMTILQGARDAKSDRERFMKSVFLFWVLGAIDGHAKNFSVMIEASGRYKLSPLYDVMSAYPIAAKRQLEWKDLKMAMALKGKNRHYHWHEIQPRHWLSMAEHCQFPSSVMGNIMEEVFYGMESVIKRVSEILPKNFPPAISEPIFDGMQRVLKKRSHHS